MNHSSYAQRSEWIGYRYLEMGVLLRNSESMGVHRFQGLFRWKCCGKKTQPKRGSFDHGYTTRTDLVSHIDHLSSFWIPPHRFGCEFVSLDQLQEGFPFALICGRVGFSPMFCGEIEI
jgi:hypothetical protein